MPVRWWPAMRSRGCKLTKKVTWSWLPNLRTSVWQNGSVDKRRPEKSKDSSRPLRKGGVKGKVLQEHCIDTWVHIIIVDHYQNWTTKRDTIISVIHRQTHKTNVGMTCITVQVRPSAFNKARFAPNTYLWRANNLPAKCLQRQSQIYSELWREYEPIFGISWPIRYHWHTAFWYMIFRRSSTTSI